MKKLSKYFLMALLAVLMTLSFAACGGDNGGQPENPIDGNLISANKHSISAGRNHSLAIDSSGSLWAWGSNEYGQLGDGTNTSRNTPVKIMADTKFAAVSAGYSHSLAIDEDNNLWAWGWNRRGQLGDNTDIDKNTPVKTKVGNYAESVKIVSISAGYHHNLAIDEDGNIWAWGGNSYGELGDGTTTSRNTPVKIKVGNYAENVKIVSISTGNAAGAAPLLGGSHSLAIDDDGNIWAWGFNNSGELGNGRYKIQGESTPDKIKADAKFISISAASGSSLAIDSSGNRWAWGSNGSGRFGDGTTESSQIPLKIKARTKFISIDASRLGLAIDNSGNLWGWGNNEYGQLGDGTTTDNIIPVKIKAGTRFVSISAGLTHCLALDEAGNLWGWGNNGFGQLGDGTNTDRYSPVSITMGVKLVVGTISYDNDTKTVSWDNVANASGYQIKIGASGTYTSNGITESGGKMQYTVSLLDGDYTAYIVAKGDGAGYSDSDPKSLSFNVSTPTDDREYGTITGTVKDAITSQAIQGAVVEIIIDGNVFVTTTVESDGSFALNLPVGTYSIKVSLKGYKVFTAYILVEADRTSYLEMIFMVKNVSSNGNVSGIIANSKTNSGLSNTILEVRSGWNNADGAILGTYSTDAAGNYEFTLPYGYYTVTASNDGFIAAVFNVSIGASSVIRNYTLSPIDDNEYSIVLTWGIDPYDLDSHLTAQGVHIYFDNRSSTNAWLDVDDIDSYGPETITINNLAELGGFKYSVHDYTNLSETNSTALSNSGATVRIYRGTELVRTYYIPTGQVGTEWNVFEIDANGIITDLNTFKNQTDSDSVGL